MGKEKSDMYQKAIFVLDDDAAMRRSLAFLLELSGYTVAAYADPTFLFGDLVGAWPACAIIDIHLTGTDGLAIGRSLKSIRPDLPMIFITGRVDQRIREGAASLGAVALLEKPFSEPALLEAISQGIEGSRQTERATTADSFR